MGIFLFLFILVPSFFSLVLAVQPTVIHLDVEPQGLPEWTNTSESQSEIANEYLDLLSSVKSALPSSIQLKVTVAMQYSTLNIVRNNQTKVLLEWVLEVVDAAILMDYRNFAITCPPKGACPSTDSILSHAVDALNVSEPMGKQMFVGVDTADEPLSKETFYGQGEAFMELAINETFGYLAPRYKTFAGMYVEDDLSYLTPSFLNSSLNGIPRICRGLWMWNTTSVVTTNFDSFLNEAAGRGITTIAIDSQSLVVDYQASFKCFIESAAEQGIAVEILFGDATWCYTANHAILVSLVEAGVSFIQGSSKGSISAPQHCSPFWSSNQETGTPSPNPSSTPSPSSSSSSSPTPSESHANINSVSIPLFFYCLLACLFL